MPPRFRPSRLDTFPAVTRPGFGGFTAGPLIPPVYFPVIREAG